jgi:ketosteroid isomerase-like protein
MEANVESLRGGYDALNRGDLSQVFGLMAPDIVWQSGTLEGDAGRGRESFQRFLESWLDSFETFRVDPEEILERGEHLRRHRAPDRARADERRGDRDPDRPRVDHRRRQAVRWRGYPNREAALTAIARGEA